MMWGSVAEEFVQSLKEAEVSHVYKRQKWKLGNSDHVMQMRATNIIQVMPITVNWKRLGNVNYCCDANFYTLSSTNQNVIANYWPYLMSKIHIC